jgi:hypothetical protein
MASGYEEKEEAREGYKEKNRHDDSRFNVQGTILLFSLCE